MVTLTVDEKEIRAQKGASVLGACLQNDIYIPNLCWMEEFQEPSASCRLCFVEIEGVPGPVPSCAVKVSENMKVVTDTPEVRRLQKTGFQLLMSAHLVNCKECPANKKCELQKIAKFLKVGLKPKNLIPCLKEESENQSHPFLDIHLNRCVLCGRCLKICIARHGKSYLTFARRGINTSLTYFGDGNTPECPDCMACVENCPVFALTLKEGFLKNRRECI